ncbi:hypothetical protein MHU86_4231 [Fragilaria crotonensis]|nr:hypothetical protein MHU86_4231 [Fragilaria crotonensis]
MNDILTLDNKANWSGIQFWQDLSKIWTITDEHDDDFCVDDVAKCSPKPVGGDSPHRSRLLEDGYALVDRVQDDPRYDELTLKLRECISFLHTRHLPATFILLCDETWEYAQYAKKILKDSTHSSNSFNFDVLAWYIDPKENAAGFSPHRDRQPEETSSSFHDDHQAKYVTMWTALSHATPENSCLYVIPKQYDPGYLAGDEDADPLLRALSTKESYQNIRALPRQPGESVLFTHRILHWGSRGNPQTSPEPRIAISFVCSDCHSFERSYVNPNYFHEDRIPPFRIRLLLVCAQLLIYYQRFDLSKSCIRACYEYCKEHEAELDPTYRRKVGIEFVKAMQEAAVTVENGESAKARVANDEDEDEDAVLEEMLEAEQQGYGEFEDDYDELGQPVDDSDGESFSEDEEEAGEGALFGKRKAENAGDANAKRKAKSS